MCLSRFVSFVVISVHVSFDRSLEISVSFTVDHFIASELYLHCGQLDDRVACVTKYYLIGQQLNQIVSNRR